MRFATNRTVALVCHERSLRRLGAGLRSLVGPERDFWAVNPDRPVTDVIGELIRMEPAGILLEYDEAILEGVTSLGMPTVVVLADLILEGMGSVNVDDAAVGRLAAEALSSRGLRHFAYFGRTSSLVPEYKHGFLERAAESTSVPVAELEWTEAVAVRLRGQERRQRSLEAFLEALPKPVGVFTTDDLLGREALAALRRLELQVPGDVAVISASNDPLACELVHPGLSSIELPWEAVGLHAGQLLERMIRGESVETSIQIKPQGIRTRGSTDFFRAQDDRTRRALQVLQDRLGDSQLGIAELARRASLDRRLLERLFRKELGESPKQLLTRLRAERARELVDEGQLRIGEIAERCGFGVSEKLTLAFRHHFGETPRERRRRLRPS
jgi:LacI family transcriptional regulator